MLFSFEHCCRVEDGWLSDTDTPCTAKGGSINAGAPASSSGPAPDTRWRSLPPQSVHRRAPCTDPPVVITPRGHLDQAIVDACECGSHSEPYSSPRDGAAISFQRQASQPSLCWLGFADGDKVGVSRGQPDGSAAMQSRCILMCGRHLDDLSHEAPLVAPQAAHEALHRRQWSLWMPTDAPMGL